MSIVFRDRDGDRITVGGFAILTLVGLLNGFICGYVAMLLFGALHSSVAQVPAFGIWASVGVTVLFRILLFENGPITWKSRS